MSPSLPATEATQGESPDSGGPEAAIACDVLVVGGGINGVGIARDLAGRGWKVMLCEQDDLGAHTSSAATKLLHGDLQGLADRQFTAVRRALQERELLMAAAPHITRAMRFVIPHDPTAGGAWRLHLGMFFYDHLSVREWLPGSSMVDLRDDPAGAALRPQFSQGFTYSDGWVDDARLVVLCAMDAAERGAAVLTHTRCLEAVRQPSGWSVDLQRRDQSRIRVDACALVNATGPWAESFLSSCVRAVDGQPLTKRQLPMLRGSHIVVPRLFDHEQAYVLPTADSRLVFALPFEGRYTLIGACESPWRDAPGALDVQEAEEAWLCEQVGRYLRRSVTPADIVWRFAGVRHRLQDLGPDAKGAWRDHLLDFERHGAPLLTVWGGKLTTFRRVAEEAADELSDLLGDSRPSWTRDVHLPGGDLSEWIGPPQRPDEDFERFVAELRRRYPWLGLPLTRRWARHYGGLIVQVVGSAHSLADLGCEVAPDVFEAELRYLKMREWALTADDVLWRRTKLGLALEPAERQAVVKWFERSLAAGGPALGSLSSREIRGELPQRAG